MSCFCGGGHEGPNRERLSVQEHVATFAAMLEWRMRPSLDSGPSYDLVIDRHNRILRDEPCAEEDHIFEHDGPCHSESHCQACCSDMPRLCLVCRRAIDFDGKALAP